jgi:hypothetical protein
MGPRGDFVHIVVFLCVCFCPSRGKATSNIQKCIRPVAEYYLDQGLGVLGFGARAVASVGRDEIGIPWIICTFECATNFAI